MNDNELITAVRDSFTDVHSATPVERIVGRGRALRTRRRVPRVAAALGAAAAAVVAVTVAVPASHPVGGSSAQLAAWTVARQDNGSIQVTIRELRDPAGLQATLRADRVPASVTFGGQPNPACQGYPFDGSPSQRLQLMNGVVTAPAAGRDVMVIHPAALPSGAGLQIGTVFQQGSFTGFSVGLVQASPQCTGS
jgi:hypothetical protein